MGFSLYPSRVRDLLWVSVGQYFIFGALCPSMSGLMNKHIVKKKTLSCRANFIFCAVFSSKSGQVHKHIVKHVAEHIVSEIQWCSVYRANTSGCRETYCIANINHHRTNKHIVKHIVACDIRATTGCKLRKLVLTMLISFFPLEICFHPNQICQSVGSPWWQFLSVPP